MGHPVFPVKTGIQRGGCGAGVGKANFGKQPGQDREAVQRLHPRQQRKRAPFTSAEAPTPAKAAGLPA